MTYSKSPTKKFKSEPRKRVTENLSDNFFEHVQILYVSRIKIFQK